MTQPLKKLERPSFYRIVQDNLKEYILSNNLKAGDPLPSEGELARQMGISRNSLREAAKALESVGILETRHGSGLFVREFSFEPLLENMAYGVLFDLKQLDELLQVRRILEAGLMEDVIAKISDQQLVRLREVVEKMQIKAEKGESFPEEDRAFHRLMFEKLGNQVVLKLLDVFWLSFHKAAERADLKNSNPRQTYLAHLAILEAVAAKNIEQGRLALQEHYGGITERVNREQQHRSIEQS